MYRVLAIGLITLLVLVGALHYPPLWIFVLAIPVWAWIFLDAEDRRVRRTMLEHMKERVMRLSDDEDRDTL